MTAISLLSNFLRTHTHAGASQGGDTLTPARADILDARITNTLSLLANAQLDIVAVTSTDTGTVNDWNPTGVIGTPWNAVRCSGGLALTITGLNRFAFVGPVQTQHVLIINRSGGTDLTLKHQDAGSLVANRLSIGSDIILRDGWAATLRYDTTLSRWTLVGIGQHPAHDHSYAADGTALNPATLLLPQARGAGGSFATTAGPAFPAGPVGGDLHWHTGRSIQYYYDGTRWLSANEYPISMAILDTLQNTAAVPAIAGAVDQGANGAWLTRVAAWTRQTVIGSAANFMSYQLVSRSPAIVDHNLGVPFVTSADAAGNLVGHTVTIGAAVTAGDTEYTFVGTKTGAPGNLFLDALVFYRLVG